MIVHRSGKMFPVCFAACTVVQIVVAGMVAVIIVVNVDDVLDVERNLVMNVVDYEKFVVSRVVAVVVVDAVDMVAGRS